MIGEDVVVTVLDVRGDQVRIGIKAPRSVEVHREEVFLVLQRNGGRVSLEESSGTVIDLDDIEVAPAPVVATPE
jgi:carbon storage regulator